MTTATFIKLKDIWRENPYSDPPIGLLSVASNAKRVIYKGEPLEVKLLDMAYETEIPKSDIYGLSACSLDMPELLNVAHRIRQEKGGLIVAGGAHFDSFKKEYWDKEIKELPIDVICLGEGEHTFPKAVHSLDDRVKKVIEEHSACNLDLLDFPAWDLLDKEKYFSSKNGTMMTSRGCYARCAFCASPHIHQSRVRFRSVANVEKELDMLIKDYGLNFIRFQDDSMILNARRFEKMAYMIGSKGINYRCSMRTDQVTDDVLYLLKNSGCTEIGFGIESAEQHVLDLLNKNNTVDNNRRALLKAKEYNFKTRAFIMTGLPGESKTSAETMIKFLSQTNPDVVTMTSFTPLPGSDIYNHPEKYGVEIIDKDWSKYNIAIKLTPGAPFVHKLSTATTEEMELNRELLKEYLFNRNKSNVQAYNRPYKRGEFK